MVTGEGLSPRSQCFSPGTLHLVSVLTSRMLVRLRRSEGDQRTMQRMRSFAPLSQPLGSSRQRKADKEDDESSESSPGWDPSCLSYSVIVRSCGLSSPLPPTRVRRLCLSQRRLPDSHVGRKFFSYSRVVRRAGYAPMSSMDLSKHKPRVFYSKPQIPVFYQPFSTDCSDSRRSCLRLSCLSPSPCHCRHLFC